MAKEQKLKRFSYWVAPILRDAPAYSIVGKTKKEVDTALKANAEERARYGHKGEMFGKPEHRAIMYTDMMDFFEQVTNEGGGRHCGVDYNTTVKGVMK